MVRISKWLGTWKFLNTLLAKKKKKKEKKRKERKEKKERKNLFGLGHGTWYYNFCRLNYKIICIYFDTQSCDLFYNYMTYLIKNG